MPLKCLADDEPIYSFALSSDAWQALKADYRSMGLRMACCGANAIPKTSKLDTPFFAHGRRGECTSGKETKEHLLAKFLVAKAAHEAGWQVDIEVPGQTPDGEDWVADILATRGKAKVAIEIQWSPQSQMETHRRQARYAASSVRCAWLMRFSRRKSIFSFDVPQSLTLPVFALQFHDDATSFDTPQFGIKLEPFIHRLLGGQVKWAPRPGRPGHASLIILDENCYRCRVEIGVVAAVDLYDEHGLEVGLYKSDEPEAKPFIEALTADPTFRRKHRLGALRERYSKTVGGRYYANSCPHCDALLGAFFINHSFMEYGVTDSLPESIGRLPITFTKEHSDEFGEWRMHQSDTHG